LEPAFSPLNQFANDPCRFRLKVLRTREIETRNAMANLPGNPIDQEPGRLNVRISANVTGDFGNVTDLGGGAGLRG